MTSPVRPLVLFLEGVTLSDPTPLGWVEGGRDRRKNLVELPVLSHIHLPQPFQAI